MAIVREGTTLLAPAPGGVETHQFETEAEATTRAAFINEALTWIGTPFRDCADVKGPSGAVDCAMLLTRASVDSGLLKPFDPRPYSPRWHLHHSEEKFIDWIVGRFGAREVEVPRIGDVVVWYFGRCFSHGGILVNSEEVLHAYYAARTTLVSRRDEPALTSIPVFGSSTPRPVRYFDLWSAAR
jgi:cell wall-associated NlpC family hydrolase